MRPSTDSRAIVLSAVVLAVAGIATTGVAGVAAGASGASLVTVDETVRVHAVHDATIRGTAGIEPGETVTVRVQSAGDTTPRFFKSADASVGENGGFAVEFDLADLAPGDGFSVTVTHGNSSIAEAKGTVVADDVPVTSTPTETRTETAGPGFELVTAGTAIAVAIAMAWRRP